MKQPLARPRVLWFLFSFNLIVAALAPFVLDGARAVATSAGMGVVSLSAGATLLTRSRSPRPARSASSRTDA